MRLLTTGSLPPEWGGEERGGVATFHATLLAGLARRDDVELAGVLAPSGEPGKAPLPVFVRPPEAGIAEFYEDLLRELDPDVVLMNHFANTIGVTHARLASPPPAVGIAHSWHNVTFRAGGERRRAHAVTAEALGGLAALVCPSQHSRREGERLGLPYPSLTEVIPYPLQPLFLEEVEVEGPGREGVLFVGGLVRRKNPAALVEAAASLPGVGVTLVGRGEEEGRLRELIERRGLGGRVRTLDLAGADHRKRLRDLFLAASVLCLPSDSESFGIVLIEALACGTPVVGFAPTVAEIGEAMALPIGVPLADSSPAAIAAGLEATLAAEWDRTALRQAALRSFDPDAALDRYIALLARCASRPQGSV